MKTTIFSKSSKPDPELLALKEELHIAQGWNRASTRSVR